MRHWSLLQQCSTRQAAAAVKAPPPPARCWSAGWLCFSSPSLSGAGWFYIAFHCASVLLVKSRCSALEWGQSHPRILCCNNCFFNQWAAAADKRRACVSRGHIGSRLHFHWVQTGYKLEQLKLPLIKVALHTAFPELKYKHEIKVVVCFFLNAQLLIYLIILWINLLTS